MLKPVGTDEWQAWYKSTPVASFFQSPDWAQTWQTYTRGAYRPSPVLVTTSSGKTALMPLTRQKVMRGISSTWHAAPAGTYGGWLSGKERPLAGKHALELTGELMSHCRSLTIRWFPFMDIDTKGVPNQPGSGDRLLDGLSNWVDFSRALKPLLSRLKVVPDHTRVLDCSDGFAAITGEKQWRNRIQPMLNKAEKLGVEVRQASSFKDWEDYHALYLETAAGWNPPPSHIYALSFFRLLSELPDCRLWLAEIAGQPVAGAIALYGRGHTTYWHGASKHDHRSAGAANVLIARMIEDNCSREQRWFDFNPSMGIRGVDAFKRSFGAVAVETPVLEKNTIPLRMIRWISRKKAVIPGSQTVDTGFPETDNVDEA